MLLKAAMFELIQMKIKLNHQHLWSQTFLTFWLWFVSEGAAVYVGVSAVPEAQSGNDQNHLFKLPGNLL